MMFLNWSCNVTYFWDFNFVIPGALLTKTNSNGDIPSNAEDANVFIVYAAVDANKAIVHPYQLVA